MENEKKKKKKKKKNSNIVILKMALYTASVDCSYFLLMQLAKADITRRISGQNICQDNWLIMLF